MEKLVRLLNVAPDDFCGSVGRRSRLLNTIAMVVISFFAHGLDAANARDLRAGSDLIRSLRPRLVIVLTVAPAEEASEGPAPASEEWEARAASPALHLLRLLFNHLNGNNFKFFQRVANSVVAWGFGVLGFWVSGLNRMVKSC